MLIQELSVAMSEFSATWRPGLRLNVDQGFQDFLKRAGILLVTRAIPRGENDETNALRKLDVTDAFPLRISLGRRVFIDEVIVPVLGFARKNSLFRHPASRRHFSYRHFHKR